MNYYYGQDSELAEQEIISLFNLTNQYIKWSDEIHDFVYNFTGFVHKNNNMLAVFPKHYFSSDNTTSILISNIVTNEDINLLYQVIKKYSYISNSKTAIKYIGPIYNERYDSDYPFVPFYNIYNYFLKYGIYKEKKSNLVPNGNGKVSWKRTINKSNKIISQDNLIFYPLYVNKSVYKHAFISECIVFVINYTIEHFGSFLSLKDTGLYSNKFDFLGNVDYVVSTLFILKNEMFKDINIRLVQDLIDFFTQFKNKSKSGDTYICIKHFNMVWQNMIHEYLNKHFSHIDTTNDSIVFDHEKEHATISFSSHAFRDIDDSPNKFFINVDHFAYYDDVAYVFDSKYYKNITELTYKQFSYGEIIKHCYPKLKAIYNYLILPGEKNNQIHFSLAEQLTSNMTFRPIITEQYLSVKKVMQDYCL